MMLLLCLCHRLGGCVVVFCGGEQGGRESKEEVEISWRSRELSHLPSTFYLCLHSQHLRESLSTG